MNINSRYMDSPILSQPIKFVPEYRAIIMKRLLFIFTFFCLLAIHGGAQNILTLENCLRIGIENNLSLQGKRKAMQKSKYGISENRVKLLPQYNVSVKVADKVRVLGNEYVRGVIAKESETVDRLVVRASGTEPVIRIFAEAETMAQAKGAAERVRRAILRAEG